MEEESKWIGEDMPSLEACDDDEFEFAMLGYDVRRLILARDPLCAVNAFGIFIRTVLAPSLGMRMWPSLFCIVVVLIFGNRPVTRHCHSYPSSWPPSPQCGWGADNVVPNARFIYIDDSSI